MIEDYIALWSILIVPYALWLILINCDSKLYYYVSRIGFILFLGIPLTMIYIKLCISAVNNLLN